MRAAIGALAVGALLWGGVAAAQQPKPADCPKAEKVQGQIVKVDAEQGKLTLQGSDGKTYEFNASKETLQDKKVGDKLELSRRLPEGCK